MWTKAMIFMTASVLASCSTGSLHSVKEQEMTLGVVQKELRQGMSQGDVATVLGSPNIVTKDQNGVQTWVYDKIASEISYKQNTVGIWSLIGLRGDVGAGGYGHHSGGQALTQKTLTVVIKFDDKGLVDTVSYNSSKF